MKRMIREIFYGSLIIFFVTAAFSGCIPLLIGAAAGAGGFAYVKGALVQNVDETVEDIHRAALAGLKDLELFVAADELNRHSALIKAESEDGKKIDVKVDAITEFVSKITIRVGMIGDREESRMVFDAIESHL